MPSPGNQLRSRLTFESSITPDHPYYKHIVYKNPLFHFIITAEEFGYIPFTMTRSAELSLAAERKYRDRDRDGYRYRVGDVDRYRDRGPNRDIDKHRDRYRDSDKGGDRDRCRDGDREGDGDMYPYL